MFNYCLQEIKNWRRNSKKRRLYRQICTVLDGMQECVDIVTQYRNYPVTIKSQDAEKAMAALCSAIEAIDCCLAFMDAGQKKQIRKHLDLFLEIMR